MKRQRSESTSQPISEESLVPDTSTDSNVKLARASSEPPDHSSEALVCTLAPTCSKPNSFTVVANADEMERHYAIYHANVCSEKGCAAVFPEARFLELHQSECHDPLCDIRRERGEKTFQCFLESCERRFMTPKTRRLHLISSHGYPKEYFFAITNKGIGGLLQKWGEGVSLIRGEWRGREEASTSDDAVDPPDPNEASKIHGEFTRDLPPHISRDLPVPVAAKQIQLQEKATNHRLNSHSTSGHLGKTDESLDALTSRMDTLSLVPPSIRFGRGGRQVGFMPRTVRDNAAVKREQSQTIYKMEVESDKQDLTGGL